MEFGKVEFSEGIYIGTILNGKADGYGAMVYNNGDVYVGEWQNNCQTGRGAKKTSSYRTMGYFSNGLRQGKCCSVENKSVSGWGVAQDYYIGEFSNDRKCGYGVLVDHNHNAYLSNFANDKPNGKGCLSYFSTIDKGYFAEGNFVNGNFSGQYTSYARTTFGNGQTFYGHAVPDLDYYTGYGEWIASGSCPERRIGFHNKLKGDVPSNNFKGVKIFNYSGHYWEKAVEEGDWGTEIYSKRGFFSKIFKNGDCYMGNYSFNEISGTGIYCFEEQSYNMPRPNVHIRIADSDQKIRINSVSDPVVKFSKTKTEYIELYKDGRLVKSGFDPLTMGTAKKETQLNLSTYQGTLNNGSSSSSYDSYSSSSYESSDNSAGNNDFGANNSSANNSSANKGANDDYVGYTEDYVYTGPYADLVIDDLNPSLTQAQIIAEQNAKNSAGTNKMDSAKNNYGAPSPIFPNEPEPQRFSDAYEKIGFFDRIKLELENKREERERNNPKNKKAKEEKPAYDPWFKQTNENLVQLKEEYEFDSRATVRGTLTKIKVKKEMHDLPPTVRWVKCGLFTDDDVVKKVKFNYNGYGLELNRETFVNCSNLEEVDVSKAHSLTIQEGAFKNCPSLKYLYVRAYGEIDLRHENPFPNCPNLIIKEKHGTKVYNTEYTVEKFVEKYLSRFRQIEIDKEKKKTQEEIEQAEAIEFGKKHNLEVKLYNGKKELIKVLAPTKKIIIPEGIEIVCTNSFNTAKEIVEEVVFPASVTSIGSSIFEGFKKLKKVDMSKTKDYALAGNLFKNATNLNKVLVPITVERVIGSAFENCTSLEKIDLPEVFQIQEDAFKNCTSLKEVNAPNLRHIFKGAFTGCTNLQRIYIDKNRCVVENGALPKGFNKVIKEENGVRYIELTPKKNALDGAFNDTIWFFKNVQYGEIKDKFLDFFKRK